MYLVYLDDGYILSERKLLTGNDFVKRHVIGLTTYLLLPLLTSTYYFGIKYMLIFIYFLLRRPLHSKRVQKRGRGGNARDQVFALPTRRRTGRTNCSRERRAQRI